MVLVDHLTVHSRPTSKNTNTNKIFQSTSQDDPMLSRETIQFRDNNAGYIDSRGTDSDPTRDLAMVQDVTLDSWFSRPVKIAEYTWEVDAPLFKRFNPWTLFWENQRNREKISNYYLLRSTLHVKFLINGNAFYYGRAIAAYEPLSPLDNTSPKDLGWSPGDRIRGSQRMHIYLNPTTSQGGSLELPFFWPKNNWIISSNQWRDMGEIVLADFNTLQHANGGTEDLNITVMAWAENVKFAIPTRAVPQLSQSEGTRYPMPESGKGDEHEQNVISRPATNVARVAGAMSSVPVIGPYAKATQIGANAVASAAKLFGLSAPNELTYDIYEPRAKHSLAVTDTKQSANKLTFDSKQELTIDPRTTGIRGDDELPIASIAGRESYLTQFTWNQTDVSGNHLWNARVDPGLTYRDNEKWYFPACAFAALPFEYWRGTMRFRFQVVASEYHKGRLRFSYDPSIGGSSSEYNTHYSTIHDIAESKDFSIDVGWGQDVPYRQSLGWSTNSEYGTIPVILNSQAGNGVLSVNVVNKLSTPSESIAPIQINVFISMLDDFEVAVPDKKISYLKFRPPINPVRNIPESGVVEADADDQGGEPVDPPPIQSTGDTGIDTPDTTMVFIGETVASFRTLLKRANKTEIFMLPNIPSTTMVDISRSSYPTYGGFVTSTLPNGSMVTTFGDGRKYNPCLTTLLNYLGRAFVGWRGSTRWTIDTSTLHLASQGSEVSADHWNSISFALSRANEYTLDTQFADSTGVLPTNLPQRFNERERGADLNGMYLGNTSVNPIQTVEVPYMQNDRFKLTCKDDDYSTTTKGPGWKCTILMPAGLTGTNNSYVRFYVSAGEDFNLFFFNGLPPVYYEADYALDASG